MIQSCYDYLLHRVETATENSIIPDELDVIEASFVDFSR